MHAYLRLLLQSFAVAILAFGLAPEVFAAEEPAEGDEYEAPPEGYEERHYSIADLIRVPQDFEPNSTTEPWAQGAGQALTGDQVIEVIKYSVLPESWTKRGPARIREANGDLVVLHKKEALDEIAKVLQFLAEGAAAPCRITVVAATLKPDALKKFADAGSAAPADLFKALEDAGDAANAEMLELRAVEGQRATASGTERKNYIRDYDVSGAVYHPVIGTLASGLLVRARAARSPDGKSARVDLDVRLERNLAMEKAQIALEGVTTAAAPSDKKDAPPPGPAAPARFKSALQIDLPTQLVGMTNTTITVPRGIFVLAGTLDLSLAGGKTPERVALFVRVAIGGEGVPTLQGVSGLKENESFRLYPLLASAGQLQDYPGPESQIMPDVPWPVQLGAQANRGGNGTVVANAFADPAARAPTLTTPVFKAKQMFAEKVRKNKVVEAMGPFFFTRLTADDHAKMLKTLMDDYQRGTSPLRLRAIAVAVPPAAYQKLALADTQTFDSAAIEALAGGAGAQLLTDTCLRLLRAQRANVFGGRQKSIVADYEISGDSYDPVIRQVLDQGYVFDARSWPPGADKMADVELRFTVMPGAATSDRTVLDSFSVNSGANVEVLLGIRADLDRLKNGIVVVKGNAKVPLGKYVLAGAAHMPPGPDGKPDPRQAIVFVGADSAP